VAPQLLWFELASIAFKKTARHPGLLEQIREASNGRPAGH
jgi:hypothetical protein